ncbi:MAG: cardiolipin synthase [Oscillospiraceae bacterium]|nr:cardiolipin synthase [Oscillospiraceae bacterium]
MRKKIITYDKNGQQVEKEVFNIPFRFIFAVALTVIETAMVLAIVIALMYVPYFPILVLLTLISVVLMIINSNDNPDYKIPWLLIVLTIPVAGFMIYFMYYSRRFPKKYIRRLERLASIEIKNDSEEFAALKKEDIGAYGQAMQICKTAAVHLYRNTCIQYFDVGEKMHEAMLCDLRNAEKYIFMEYFLIEPGVFWNSILEILKEKAAAGTEVRLVYDDIGCMALLPGDYYKTLRKMGIQAVPFAKLKGQANNEFNNRSHRKITVIDGKIGYTGGINISDEYINVTHPFGHWKDTGIRLEGEAAAELAKMFITDYSLNFRKSSDEYEKYCIPEKREGSGFLIPFGSGPKPMYKREVGKGVIMNMLNCAKHYVYITTPYLIIDNELSCAIENAAIRGVDIKIVTPGIPDKKVIFGMTRSSYKRLIDSGVQIYEYTPGFIHAKMYVCDDEIAVIGTINLDYRSLVHHFENGVWLYKCDTVGEIKSDILDTVSKSRKIEADTINDNLFIRFLRSVIRIFAPML